MNVTDSLINAALLGTAAKEFVPDGLPEELQSSLEVIQSKAEDTEAAFYRFSATAFAYSRAGLEPQAGDPTAEQRVTDSQEEFSSAPALTSQPAIRPLTASPIDDKQYFDRQAGELLTTLIGNRNRHLLLYAYRKASASNKLIPPPFLPALLTRAFDRNNPSRHEEQALLPRITGQRGRWLLPHLGLPTWGEAGTETWETASHEERKRMLTDLRRNKSAEGLALLQTELKNESAAHRDELIQCLRINLSQADEAFLESIAATDRSSNVKDTARMLLCSMPDSQLVRTFADMLRGRLRHNILMGWSYTELGFTPEMKKLGLEEVSPNKGEKDGRFLLRQLAERVPLSFWCELFDCSPEKAATKLAKSPPFSPLFNLGRVIANFGDATWAYHTLRENQDDTLVTSLVPFLTPAQREDLPLKPDREHGYIPDTWFNSNGEAWFSSNGNSETGFSSKGNNEAGFSSDGNSETGFNSNGAPWGIKFSTYAFRRVTQGKNYYVSKETAEALSIYFPPEMLKQVEQMAVSGDPEQSNTRFARHVLEYMHQKKQIDAYL